PIHYSNAPPLHYSRRSDLPHAVERPELVRGPLGGGGIVLPLAVDHVAVFVSAGGQQELRLPDAGGVLLQRGAARLPVVEGAADGDLAGVGGDDLEGHPLAGRGDRGGRGHRLAGHNGGFARRTVRLDGAGSRHWIHSSVS